MYEWKRILSIERIFCLYFLLKHFFRYTPSVKSVSIIIFLYCFWLCYHICSQIRSVVCYVAKYCSRVCTWKSVNSVQSLHYFTRHNSSALLQYFSCSLVIWRYITLYILMVCIFVLVGMSISRVEGREQEGVQVAPTATVRRILNRISLPAVCRVYHFSLHCGKFSQ